MDLFVFAGQSNLSGRATAATSLSASPLPPLPPSPSYAAPDSSEEESFIPSTCCYILTPIEYTELPTLDTLAAFVPPPPPPPNSPAYHWLPLSLVAIPTTLFSYCSESPPKRARIGLSPLNFLLPDLLQNTPHSRSVGIVLLAVGGTSMQTWEEENGGELQTLIEHAYAHPPEGLAVSLKSIVWYQGESDSTAALAPLYAPRFLSFANNLAEFLQTQESTAATFPLIVIPPTSNSIACPEVAALRTAITTIPTSSLPPLISRTIVSPVGLPLAPDRLHLSVLGCRILATLLLPAIFPTTIPGAPPPPPPLPWLIPDTPACNHFLSTHAQITAEAVAATNADLENFPFDAGGFSLGSSSRPPVNFTYGELMPLTVSHILYTVLSATTGAVSVADLGCGVGSVLLSAVLDKPERVRGVVGVDVMSSYVKQAGYSQEYAAANSTTSRSVAMRVGDFCEEANREEWVRCGVVFACSTMFEATLMADIVGLFVAHASDGAWLVTLDKAFDGVAGVERVAEIEGEGSWGRTRCVLHRKVPSKEGGQVGAVPDGSTLW